MDKTEAEAIMQHNPIFNMTYNQNPTMFYIKPNISMPRFLHARMKLIAEKKYNSDMTEAYAASAEMFLREHSQSVPSAG